MRVLWEEYEAIILFEKRRYKRIQCMADARGGQAHTLQILRFYEEYNATIPFAKMISWLAATPPIRHF